MSFGAVLSTGHVLAPFAALTKLDWSQSSCAVLRGSDLSPNTSAWQVALAVDWRRALYYDRSGFVSRAQTVKDSGEKAPSITKEHVEGLFGREAKTSW